MKRKRKRSRFSLWIQPGTRMALAPLMVIYLLDDDQLYSTTEATKTVYSKRLQPKHFDRCRQALYDFVYRYAMGTRPDNVINGKRMGNKNRWYGRTWKSFMDQDAIEQCEIALSLMLNLYVVLEDKRKSATS